MVPDKTLAWVRAIHPIRYGGKRVVIYYKKLLEAYLLNTELIQKFLIKSYQKNLERFYFTDQAT